MRTGISITITPFDRGRLEAIAGDRNSPQKHACRAAIVLLTAGSIGTNEIMRRTGKSKTSVWRPSQIPEGSIAGSADRSNSMPHFSSTSRQGCRRRRCSRRKP
jgi:hypothetical protein